MLTIIRIFYSTDEQGNVNNTILGNHIQGNRAASGAHDNYMISNKANEASPLLPKETIITIDYVSVHLQTHCCFLVNLLM